MRVVLTDVKNIKPYHKNPRINDDAVAQVAESIKSYGFQQPIVVDKKNVVIVGHTRLLAAKELGLKQVPVVFANDLTPKQVKAYRIADNKTNEFAKWDFDLLKDELLGLDNLFTGFDISELDDLLGNEAENDSDKYTKKTSVPLYEPSNKKPSLEELFDSTNTLKIIEAIRNSDIPENEKDFLILAAGRHTVLNFELIADYYAHSNKEVQELMEDSALVIVDVDKAIEKGWATLSDELSKQYSDDNE